MPAPAAAFLVQAATPAAFISSQRRSAPRLGRNRQQKGDAGEQDPSCTRSASLGTSARRRKIHGDPPRHGGITLGLQAELPAPCPRSQRVPTVPSCPLGDHLSPVPTPVRTRELGFGGSQGAVSAVPGLPAWPYMAVAPRRAGQEVTSIFSCESAHFLRFFFSFSFLVCFLSEAALPLLRAVPSGPVAAPGHGWDFGSQSTPATGIQPDTEQNPQTFFCGAALTPHVCTHPGRPLRS